MSNNRAFISDAEIIRPAQLLDKGLPLPGLSGRYVVDEGWCAIITEGGAFKEILAPGTHFLNRYHLWRDVKATAVDTRIHTLSVSTTREFTIAQPVPVEVNLDLAVEYRVSDPRRVATEIGTPLTSLYDRVIQAVRGAVVEATVDEIRRQGEGLARITLQRLQAMQLPKVLGIEIFNVLVTTIKATDAGTDALAALQMEELAALSRWRTDSFITQNSRVTWEWLAMHRPEIAQQILATYGQVAIELIDKGLLDPAGFLNQPAAAGGPPGAANLLAAFPFPSGLLPGGPASPGQPAPGAMLPAGPGQPQLPGQAGAAQPAANDVLARIREDKRLLETGLPGGKVEARAGMDTSADSPDGNYYFDVGFPRSSGGGISLFIRCPIGYPGPQAPPLLEVKIDDQQVPFESAILRRWSGQYLVEIAREVKQYFG